jgi:formamidopyrimidine-DNA glycosylase
MDKNIWGQIMPEGPEVQLIVDYLNRYKNLKVTEISIYDKRYLKKGIQQLHNCTLTSITRKAKYLIWEFQKEKERFYCVNHLAMTGSWIVRNLSKIPMHSRFSFFFSVEQSGAILDFVDTRKWGKFDVYTSEEFWGNEKVQKKLSSLGPDALNESISVDYLVKYFDDLKKPWEIKPLLMEQNFIAGIGNIYACEICFLADLDPTKEVKDLSLDEIFKLSEAIPAIIKRAYNNGGSTIKDYIKPDGSVGNDQATHFVYGKKVCLTCKSKIAKIAQCGRSTYWCKTCQK